MTQGDERQHDNAAMVTALEETARHMMDLLRALPWEHTPGDLARWEELLERTAQVRIRLQRAREQASTSASPSASASAEGERRSSKASGRGRQHGHGD